MRILIVEDEEKLAKSIKTGLEKEGYAADYVLDGEAAETRIELHHSDYDLVLLDLMLPKRDGFTVCQNIRKLKLSIPVLVLTAKVDVNDKITALNFGADDYLVKPFAFDELLARIRALLRRPTETLPTELKVKNLSLNVTTRQVFRNGKELELTLKEFNLLEYLMRHPNQVLTREQILAHLWDFDYNSFSNVIDVHIKNLRKKINGSGHEKLLETIYGVGYKLKG